MGTKYYFRTAIQEKNAAFFQVLKNDKKTLEESRVWNGALRAIRTPDPQLRRLLLYPAELGAQ